MKTYSYTRSFYSSLSLVFFIIFILSISNSFAQDFNPAFDHQAIVVSDLDASATFYMEVVGLKEIENQTGKPTRRWFSLGGNHELHLLADEMEGVKVNKSIHMAITVSNFDKFVDNLRARNITFTDWPGEKDKVTTRPDGIKQVYIMDPDGYSIEVNSRAESL